MKDNKGSNIERFQQLLNDNSKKANTITLRRGIVKDVDWDKKTMTVTDLVENLDHFDVRLGLGFMNVRPAYNSLVIIAVIGNKDVDTLLIDAQSVEQIEYQDSTGFKLDLNQGKMTINGDSFSGLVKAPELKSQVDKNTAILQAIQNALQSWSPQPLDGGAELKALTSTIPSMQRADLDNIENQNIKHG